MTFTWDKSLATGSANVDHQHQELFRQAAALSNAMKQGRGRDEICELLDFLGQYILRHFAEEEELMEELNCPAAATNKVAHARFFTTFSRLQRHFKRAGSGPSLVLQIHDLLTKWLVQHIKEIDSHLRDYRDPASSVSLGRRPDGWARNLPEVGPMGI